VGSLIGRKRAFAIGCVIYGLGSFTTALAPNVTIPILGWSVLEGLGGALILPAIVALVAGNVPPEGRPRAYGLIMAAGAIAVAVGPLIGRIATTYYSWRWVFVGEQHVEDGERVRSRALSVALGLWAIDTGLKIMPLSITLLIAPAGIPRFFPNSSPRRVVQAGLLAIFAGIVSLFMSIDVDASAEIVTVPLLLAGFGIGALASQLGSVTVSAVPDDESAEVGGLQNQGPCPCRDR
jgi:MFS family permease